MSYYNNQYIIYKHSTNIITPNINGASFNLLGVYDGITINNSTGEITCNVTLGVTINVIVNNTDTYNIQLILSEDLVYSDNYIVESTTPVTNMIIKPYNNIIGNYNLISASSYSSNISVSNSSGEITINTKITSKTYITIHANQNNILTIFNITLQPRNKDLYYGHYSFETAPVIIPPILNAYTRYDIKFDNPTNGTISIDNNGYITISTLASWGGTIFITGYTDIMTTSIKITYGKRKYNTMYPSTVYLYNKSFKTELYAIQSRPYYYSLFGHYDGVSIDNSTGKITIDRNYSISQIQVDVTYGSCIYRTPINLIVDTTNVFDNNYTLYQNKYCYLCKQGGNYLINPTEYLHEFGNGIVLLFKDNRPNIIIELVKDNIHEFQQINFSYTNQEPPKEFENSYNIYRIEEFHIRSLINPQNTMIYKINDSNILTTNNGSSFITHAYGTTSVDMLCFETKMGVIYENIIINIIEDVPPYYNNYYIESLPMKITPMSNIETSYIIESIENISVDKTGITINNLTVDFIAYELIFL